MDFALLWSAARYAAFAVTPAVTPAVPAKSAVLRSAFVQGGQAGHILSSFGHIADMARTGFSVETSWKLLETLKPSCRANHGANQAALTGFSVRTWARTSEVRTCVFRGNHAVNRILATGFFVFTSLFPSALFTGFPLLTFCSHSANFRGRFHATSLPLPATFQRRFHGYFSATSGYFPCGLFVDFR